jgi:hypothetical protein
VYATSNGLKPSTRIHPCGGNRFSGARSSFITQNIDVAFYLIHSLTARAGVFEDKEERCANNFNT